MGTQGTIASIHVWRARASRLSRPPGRCTHPNAMAIPAYDDAVMTATADVCCSSGMYRPSKECTAGNATPSPIPSAMRHASSGAAEDATSDSERVISALANAARDAAAGVKIVKSDLRHAATTRRLVLSAADSTRNDKHIKIHKHQAASPAAQPRQQDAPASRAIGQDSTGDLGEQVAPEKAPEDDALGKR